MNQDLKLGAKVVGGCALVAAASSIVGQVDEAQGTLTPNAVIEFTHMEEFDNARRVRVDTDASGRVDRIFLDLSVPGDYRVVVTANPGPALVLNFSGEPKSLPDYYRTILSSEAFSVGSRAEAVTHEIDIPEYPGSVNTVSVEVYKAFELMGLVRGETPGRIILKKADT
jgi:hypothetical protein